jgi:hypothetical protein
MSSFSQKLYLKNYKI